MHRLALCVGVLFAFSASAAARANEPADNTLTQEEIVQGWILLFDGETTFGWQPTTEANWTVADGVISVDSGERGFLNTTSPWADYELRVDFRSAAGTNSGVFLRNGDPPKDPATDCYELNIASPAISPFPTGSFVGRKRAEGEHDTMRWRTFHVTAAGGRFTVLLDGETVLDYTDEKPLGRGPIGLQFNSGRVEFKNVKLRPLSLQPIFNGQDLGGWTISPDSQSKFEVTPEGWLSLQGGEGYLMSDQQYGDFCLQWQVRSNAEGGNSGMFFRSIPGEVKLGYECQIQNTYLDGDRTQPKDCGTGGIYRRQNARRVMSDDGQWAAVTLAVAGDHMSAWVNGYPVSDWTDTREPDPNPRQGRRREAGTLQIQGHAPPLPADFVFRGLQIVELPPR